jgi:hypothetical protein
LPDDIPSVIKPIIDNKTLVCYGSRHLDKGQNKKNKIWFRKHIRQTLLAFLGSKIITSLCNILFSSTLTDVPTCYKAFDTKLLKGISLNNNGFELEAEITAKVLKKTSIIEVPIHYFPRTRSEGKKICWRDGFKFLFNLIKYRFVS